MFSPEIIRFKPKTKVLDAPLDTKICILAVTVPANFTKADIAVLKNSIEQNTPANSVMPCLGLCSPSAAVQPPNTVLELHINGCFNFRRQ